MGVDLYWKDERGKELGAVGDPKMLLARHVQSASWAETSCLRFIDPYGNTMFNQSQIPLLIRELEASMKPAIDPATTEHVSRVVALLRTVDGEDHTYAWFIGD